MLGFKLMSKIRIESLGLINCFPQLLNTHTNHTVDEFTQRILRLSFKRITEIFVRLDLFLQNHFL